MIADLARIAGLLQKSSRRHSGLDLSEGLAAKQERPDGDEGGVECAIYSLMTQQF